MLIAVTLLLCAGGITSGVLLVNRATDKAEEAINNLPTPPSLTVPQVPTEVPEVPGLPTDLPELPTNLPQLPGEGTEIEVEYEVTGDGPVEIVYMEDLGKEPKRVSDAKLPWRKTVKLRGSSLVSVVAVRGNITDGSISCSAKVNGEEVAQKTSTGTFITATCSKVIF
ncbi:MmpS family transport accessory protein [Actinoplanes sp. NPDC051859]|uniref:MmpS family transport accessory protein n=1 Tax=Actinoplanes sp. NPDC051859 TaxID=3363909 RepID=UPI0037AD72D7